MQKMFKTEWQIKERVSELANEISLHFDGNPTPPVLLGVMNGALYFMADLSRAMSIGHEIQTCSARSYVNDEQTGHIAIKLNWDASTLPLQGKDVVIVDDVLDSGRTIDTITRIIAKQQRARSVSVCVLVNKERVNTKPKFVGFTASAPDYLVGYGMDSKGLYRNQTSIKIKG